MAWGLPGTTIKIPPHSSNCPLCGAFISCGEHEGIYYGTCENCHVTSNMSTMEVVYFNPTYWDGKEKKQPWAFHISKAISVAAEEFKNG